MATTESKPAAAAQSTPGPEKNILVRGRETGQDLPPAKKHTNEEAIPAGDVVGFKVASEAAQPGGGTGPFDGGVGGISGATEIRNPDVKKRHDEELKRRGAAGDTFQVSATFEGMRMVENGLQEPFPVSGSYGGPVDMKHGLVLRALTPEEEKQYVPTARTSARRADDRDTPLRRDDLARGSGAGGGGNPMKAGEAAGVANPAVTGGPVGKAVTSPGQPQGSASRSG